MSDSRRSLRDAAVGARRDRSVLLETEAHGVGIRRSTSMAKSPDPEPSGAKPCRAASARRETRDRPRASRGSSGARRCRRPTDPPDVHVERLNVPRRNRRTVRRGPDRIVVVDPACHEDLPGSAPLRSATKIGSRIGRVVDDACPVRRPRHLARRRTNGRALPPIVGTSQAFSPVPPFVIRIHTCAASPEKPTLRTRSR